MDSRNGEETGRRDGSIFLSQTAAEHLRAAITQMDLLVHSRQVEPAMGNLVLLLQHLGTIRKTIT